MSSQEKDCPYYFMGQKGSNYKSRSIEDMMKTLCKKCKFEENYTPHSLRRAFATNLSQKGTNIYKIMLIMGHSRITSTQKYIIP